MEIYCLFFNICIYTLFYCLFYSRDTSVKLWKISTLSEISNMAGHNGSVTGVKLINEQETDGLSKFIHEIYDIRMNFTFC